MLFKEVHEQFLVALRADGCTRSTIDTYRYRLVRLVGQLGDQSVESVSTNQLRTHIADLRDEGTLRPVTVHSHVRAIKRMFNWIAEEGVISGTNPAERISQQPLPDMPPKAISLSDALKLLMATHEVGQPWEQVRNRAIVMFLLDTACRVSGLVELPLFELNLAERRAIVREKKGQWRFVFLLPPTVEVLEDWLKVRKERHNVSETEQAVFISRNGSQLTRFGVAQLLRRLSLVAGVEGPTNAHAFRHGFAVSYLMNDGDLATLSDLMGHKNMSTTKKFYARFLFKHLQTKHDRHSPVNQLPADLFDEQSPD